MRSTIVSEIKVPILTYHSHTIAGNTYETNNHIALFDDLRTIRNLGLKIVPLMWIVEWLLDKRDPSTLQKAVALTFDDGVDFDYYGLDHPTHGRQRSFFNILKDFQYESGISAQPHLHASFFVIASPEARKELDDRGWMSDGWWNTVNQSGIGNIFNHSWDHNHPEVSKVCQKDQKKGSFDVIDTYAECRNEVEQAAHYIQQKAHLWPVLFAYPWGQSSDYIRNHYFPSFQEQHKTVAAFAANGGYVTKSSSRWNIPRFICGGREIGWEKTDELIRILRGEF